MTTEWPHQPPIPEMCAALVGKVEIVGWRKTGLEQGMTHSTMLTKSSEVESDVLLQDDTVFFFDVYDIFIVITKTALLKTVWTIIGSEEGEDFEKYVGSGDHHKWRKETPEREESVAIAICLLCALDLTFFASSFFHPSFCLSGQHGVLKVRPCQVCFTHVQEERPSQRPRDPLLRNHRGDYRCTSL